jgi:hypothetical protein
MIDSNLQNLLREFGKTLGLDGLTFDEYGYCGLTIDDQVINIEMDEPSAALLIYAFVGELPEKPDRAFYEMLLEADFFYKGTSGATLGIDRNTRVIMMAYRLPVGGLQLHRFLRVVENFTNMMELWHEKITGFYSPIDVGDNVPMSPELMA